ncbi:MAG: NAD(P)-dependent oxidoreductase [Candidatus Micrarchaeaceae archaeon]
MEKKAVDLITGVTSRLGSALAARLIERGDEVRAIIKDSPEKLESWVGMPSGVIPYVADLTLKTSADRASLQEAATGVDNVFHIAAAVYNYKNTTEELVSINAKGTENLLDAVIAGNYDKKSIHFLFSSTASVYGHRRSGEIITEESEVRPFAPYAKSKRIAEQVIESLCMVHKDIKYTIFRISTIYGKGYEKPSFCKLFSMIKKERMKYIGKGSNHLTLVNVNDVVDAFMLALDNQASFNKTYNVSEGKPYTQKELFDMAAEYMHVKKPSGTVPVWIARILAKSKGIKSDELEFLISDRIISISKIKKDLGFEPKASISKEGLEMIDVCFPKY